MTVIEGFKRIQVSSKVHFTAAALAIGMLLATAGGAAAEAAKDEAATFLRAYFQDFNAYVEDDGLTDQQRLDGFRQLLRDGFNLDQVSRSVLDEHWKAASEAERGQFRKEFEDYLIVTYGKYVPAFEPMTLEVVAAREKAENNVQLRTNMSTNGSGQTFIVDYALYKNDGAWGIVDIRIQGFRPVAVHRSDFSGYAEDNGVNGLLAQLREKNAKLSPDLLREQPE